MVSSDMATIDTLRLLPEAHSIAFRASENQAVGNGNRQNVPVLALKSGKAMVEKRRGG